MTRDGSMHPFDDPENVVFDDSPMPEDPYPYVTRAMTALKERREVLWAPPPGCGLG